MHSSILFFKTRAFWSGFGKTLVVFFPLYELSAGSGWQWGVLYAACVLILYFRPLFNAAPLMPLVAVILILPFEVRMSSGYAQALFAVLVSFAFWVALGVKNLVLTHRERWVRCVSYGLAYVAFLAFFATSPGGMFLWAWAVTLAALACLLSVTAGDMRSGIPVLLLAGEALLVVSWLPIGPISSANACLLMLLFVADAVHEGRLGLRKTALFGLLSLVIAASSSWGLP